VLISITHARHLLHCVYSHVTFVGSVTSHSRRHLTAAGAWLQQRTQYLCISAIRCRSSCYKSHPAVTQLMRCCCCCAAAARSHAPQLPPCLCRTLPAPGTCALGPTPPAARWQWWATSTMQSLPHTAGQPRQQQQQEQEQQGRLQPAERCCTGMVAGASQCMPAGFKLPCAALLLRRRRQNGHVQALCCSLPLCAWRLSETMRSLHTRCSAAPLTTTSFVKLRAQRLQRCKSWKLLLSLPPPQLHPNRHALLKRHC
jgi:hypothetical protein